MIDYLLIDETVDFKLIKWLIGRIINWLNDFRMKKLPLSVAVDIGGNTKEDIKCVVTVSLHLKSTCLKGVFSNYGKCYFLYKVVFHTKVQIWMEKGIVIIFKNESRINSFKL